MLVLTDTQDCPVAATAKDRKGAAAMVQNPQWESSDPAVLTVTPDASDGTKALVSAVQPGTALVTFKADADLTDGVIDIIGTLDVVVGPGQATVVEVSAGTPVEQPAGSPGTAGAVITS